MIHQQHTEKDERSQSLLRLNELSDPSGSILCLLRFTVGTIHKKLLYRLLVEDRAHKGTEREGKIAEDAYSSSGNRLSTVIRVVSDVKDKAQDCLDATGYLVD